MNQYAEFIGIFKKDLEGEQEKLRLYQTGELRIMKLEADRWCDSTVNQSNKQNNGSPSSRPASPSTKKTRRHSVRELLVYCRGKREGDCSGILPIDRFQTASVRAHGVHQLLVYCLCKCKGDWPCHHSGKLPILSFCGYRRKRRRPGRFRGNCRGRLPLPRVLLRMQLRNVRTY